MHLTRRSLLQGTMPRRDLLPQLRADGDELITKICGW